MEKNFLHSTAGTMPGDYIQFPFINPQTFELKLALLIPVIFSKALK
jgi:hypothetical protein